MSSWRDQVTEALKDFVTVAKLAAARFDPAEIRVEFQDAPHRPPSSLPVGRMAVYGFCHEDKWLKIGKAGARSQARYTSQHYNPASARSTLAASLVADPTMASVAGFGAEKPGDWIKTNCCRVNILLPDSYHKAVLSLLEAFLHVRLAPRYEG